MSRDWHEESGSFERFHKDRGVKKKQKRGDRHAQKQKMRAAASDIDRYEDDTYEDDLDGRTESKHR